IRTAAASAVATDLLAQENSELLSILGTGDQARSHLEAMLLERDIKKVKVWGRNRKKAELSKTEMKEKFNESIEASDTADKPVSDAHIICTVTSEKRPILNGSWVMEGAHINAVGACTDKDRELDSELIKKSKLYVDCVESTINESGDYLIPLM